MNTLPKIHSGEWRNETTMNMNTPLGLGIRRFFAGGFGATTRGGFRGRCFWNQAKFSSMLRTHLMVSSESRTPMLSSRNLVTSSFTLLFPVRQRTARRSTCSSRRAGTTTGRGPRNSKPSGYAAWKTACISLAPVGTTNRKLLPSL